MEKHVSEKELTEEAREITASLVPGLRATVLALYGDLGAGKTTFAKAFAGALGIKEVVTSPTFVIEKIYRLERRPFERLIHIDAYRLSSERELGSIGWDEYLADPKNLIVVEWAERIESRLPADAVKIRLRVVDEGTRAFSYGR